MDPFTMALIGGSVGLGKGLLIDQPKEARQRELAAQTALYSPWTGMQPGPIQEADPFGSALQGATAGMMLGGMGGAGGAAGGAGAAGAGAAATPAMTAAPGASMSAATPFANAGAMQNAQMLGYNMMPGMSPYAGMA